MYYVCSPKLGILFVPLAGLSSFLKESLISILQHIPVHCIVCARGVHGCVSVCAAPSTGSRMVVNRSRHDKIWKNATLEPVDIQIYVWDNKEIKNAQLQSCQIALL